MMSHIDGENAYSVGKSIEADAGSVNVNRRKMLRRAANRKSAQVSRARKKSLIDDLKHENVRLQKVVDILESQPELLFCVTLTGDITYIAEKTLNFIKKAIPYRFNGFIPQHINDIFSDESVNDILESVRNTNEAVNSDQENAVPVKEVCFRDTKFKVTGYLRCSRVKHAKNSEVPQIESIPLAVVNSFSNQRPPWPTETNAKKSRKSSHSSVTTASASSGSGIDAFDKSKQDTENKSIQSHIRTQLDSLAVAAAALSSLSYISYPDTSKDVKLLIPTSSNPNQAGKRPAVSQQPLEDQDREDSSSESEDTFGLETTHGGKGPEFVCVIRPVGYSLPLNNASDLSSASMAAHNASDDSHVSSSLNSLNSNSDQSSDQSKSAYTSSFDSKSNKDFKTESDSSKSK